jgi:hypothetical protein
MSAQPDTGVFDRPRNNWPGHVRCNDCEHVGAKHRFLYGIPSQKWGQLDRYRCEAKLPTGDLCNCGEEYTGKCFVVPGKYAHLTESDSGRRTLIEMISLGVIPEVIKPK